jgi:predicted glycosyltransferase
MNQLRAHMHEVNIHTEPDVNKNSQKPPIARRNKSKVNFTAFISFRQICGVDGMRVSQRT